jgi:hypothetical protein
VTHTARSTSVTITPPALDPSGETAAPTNPAAIAAAHNENVTSTAHRAQLRPLSSPTPPATPHSPTAATAPDIQVGDGDERCTIDLHPLGHTTDRWRDYPIRFVA